MNEFNDRTILVTGGAGGIGSACARAFLERGAAVHLVDIDGGRLDSVCAQLSPLGRVTAHAGDLASPMACREAFSSSPSAVQALVHMAGVFEHDPLDVDSHVVWDRAIACNLTNAYDMSIAFRSQCVPSLPADIVLCSSRAFQRGAAGRAAYSAAKGGIVGLMRTLSREFAPGIRVNAVAPGLIDTPMGSELIATMGAQRLAEIPLGRFGRPEDIAGVVVFLCSQAASYVTGQLITVDGGTLNS